MLTYIATYFNRMRGKEKSSQRKSITEILWSGLGAFIAIYFITLFTDSLEIDSIDGFFLVGSFGASAVLIYGAPQLDFSQPRNFLGGHVISTFIGVLVYQNLDLSLASLSAIAVSLSIVAMHLTRTMHPPGGATALIAIIGSQQVHELGFSLILSPILSGSLLMLFIALIINNLSKDENRHYPKYWI